MLFIALQSYIIHLLSRHKIHVVSALLWFSVHWGLTHPRYVCTYKYKTATFLTGQNMTLVLEKVDTKTTAVGEFESISAHLYIALDLYKVTYIQLLFSIAHRLTNCHRNLWSALSNELYYKSCSM